MCIISLFSTILTFKYDGINVSECTKPDFTPFMNFCNLFMTFSGRVRVWCANIYFKTWPHTPAVTIICKRHDALFVELIRYLYISKCIRFVCFQYIWNNKTQLWDLLCISISHLFKIQIENNKLPVNGSIKIYTHLAEAKCNFVCNFITYLVSALQFIRIVLLNSYAIKMLISSSLVDGIKCAICCIMTINT